MNGVVRIESRSSSAALETTGIDVSPGARPELWYGTVEWGQRDGCWTPWRLAPALVQSIHAPKLEESAQMPAGVRLVLRTDARQILLALRVRSPDTSPFDVVVGGRLAARQILTVGDSRFAVTLPEGMTDVEIWLPQFGIVDVIEASVADGLVGRSEDKRLRWAAYGSSITQCRAAQGPSATWPAIAARSLKCDVTNLGFGGECHLDPVVVDALSAVKPHLISMCLGINVFDPPSFSPRSWTSQTWGFIRATRAACPDVPMLVMSPIATRDRESSRNSVGMTLGGIRSGIADAVSALRASGDLGVHYLKGTDVFGLADIDLLGDNVHPTHDGYALIAERMVPRLAALLPKEAPLGD